MDEQYKKMLEQLAEIRKKDRKRFLYGCKKSRRILKVKKILKNIKRK